MRGRFAAFAIATDALACRLMRGAAQAMALGLKFFRACVKENLNVLEGKACSPARSVRGRVCVCVMLVHARVCVCVCLRARVRARARVQACGVYWDKGPRSEGAPLRFD